VSNWWANKIQQQQPAGIRVMPQHHVQQAPQPVQYPQPVQQPHQYTHPGEIDGSKISYQQLAREHDGEKISKYWRGGEAMKTEGHLGCPNCGSNTSYTQYSGNAGLAAGIAGNRPRPHCFECGYNGVFVQGEQANWTV
jgi:hypothetical protein